MNRSAREVIILVLIIVGFLIGLLFGVAMWRPALIDCEKSLETGIQILPPEQRSQSLNIPILTTEGATTPATLIPQHR